MERNSVGLHFAPAFSQLFRHCLLRFEIIIMLDVLPTLAVPAAAYCCIIPCDPSSVTGLFVGQGRNEFTGNLMVVWDAITRVLLGTDCSGEGLRISIPTPARIEGFCLVARRQMTAHI
jgi:hypothetical protein